MAMHAVFYHCLSHSPVGMLHLVASERGLCRLDFHGEKHYAAASHQGMLDGEHYPLLVKTKKQLEEYFTGKRKQFDVALDPKGTVFQIKSWKVLQKIPYGTTISYKEQATRLGDAKKARAVGAANGRNPLSIVVPCHRVIGASGVLVGFGGGLPVKEYLLNLEATHH